MSRTIKLLVFPCKLISLFYCWPYAVDFSQFHFMDFGIIIPIYIPFPGNKDVL